MTTPTSTPAPALKTRLIDHLRAGGMSNRDAKRALEAGKVFLKDAPVGDATREVEPRDVSVRPDAPRCRVGRDVAYVYRDAHLAVVVKPAGLLSVPAPKRREETTLIGLASRALKPALVVHRLDQPTSGLMLVARTEECQHELKELLAVHAIDRRYLALVSGLFPDTPRTIDNLLVRDRGDGLRGKGEGPDAKRALTHLRLVSRLGKTASLVEARLETGRQHQVRIHLSEFGHAVLGDPLYGPRGSRAPRLALHSHRLRFQHPMTKAELEFEAPLADDLEKIRRDLTATTKRGRRRR